MSPLDYLLRQGARSAVARYVWRAPALVRWGLVFLFVIVGGGSLAYSPFGG